MRKLDFPDNYFDGLWVCASLLHIPKKEAGKVLEDFARVLKPDGLILIALKKGSEDKIVNGRFFSYYNEKEISELLVKTGFKISRLEVNEKNSTIWIDVFATKSL